MKQLIGEKSVVRVRHPIGEGNWTTLPTKVRLPTGEVESESLSLEIEGIPHDVADLPCDDWTGYLKFCLSSDTARVFGPLGCRLMEFDVLPDGMVPGRRRYQFQAWTETTIESRVCTEPVVFRVGLTLHGRLAITTIPAGEQLPGQASPDDRHG